MKIGNIFRSLGTEVIMLLLFGGMMLYMNAADLVVSFKPAVSFEDMLDAHLLAYLRLDVKTTPHP